MAKVKTHIPSLFDSPSLNPNIPIVLPIEDLEKEKEKVIAIDVPFKILIYSDNTTIQFIKEIRNSAGIFYEYNYTSGIYKKGMEVLLSKEQIETQLKNYFKIIN